MTSEQIGLSVQAINPSVVYDPITASYRVYDYEEYLRTGSGYVSEPHEDLAAAQRAYSEDWCCTVCGIVGKWLVDRGWCDDILCNAHKEDDWSVTP